MQKYLLAFFMILNTGLSYAKLPPPITSFNIALDDSAPDNQGTNQKIFNTEDSDLKTLGAQLNFDIEIPQTRFNNIGTTLFIAPLGFDTPKGLKLFGAHLGLGVFTRFHIDLWKASVYLKPEFKIITAGILLKSGAEIGAAGGSLGLRAGAQWMISKWFGFGIGYGMSRTIVADIFGIKDREKAKRPKLLLVEYDLKFFEFSLISKFF